MWGILVWQPYDPANLFRPCEYREHFSHGIMFDTTTQVKNSIVRGCAPHTGIVGWTEGDLEIRTHGTLAIGTEAVAVKFDGSDFFAGTRLVKGCVKMFFFKDGTCMAEGIS